MGAELLPLQVLQRDGLRVPQQSVQEANVRAGPRIGLAGAGHAEFQLSALNGPEKVLYSDLLSHKAQLFRQALPDAEYHRGDGDGLRVLQV